MRSFSFHRVFGRNARTRPEPGMVSTSFYFFNSWDEIDNLTKTLNWLDAVFFLSTCKTLYWEHITYLKHCRGSVKIERLQWITSNLPRVEGVLHLRCNGFVTDQMSIYSESNFFVKRWIHEAHALEPSVFHASVPNELNTDTKDVLKFLVFLTACVGYHKLRRTLAGHIRCETNLLYNQLCTEF